MAEVEIENVGQRKNIYRSFDLHIPLDTPREHVERAVTSIQNILANRDGLDPDSPPRVFFNEFNPDSFNIRVNYWCTRPDFWSANQLAQEINLQIFRAFEEQSIQFSLPFRHSYWKQDDAQGPLDISMRPLVE